MIVAKVGLDGHTTGAAVVASALRDAGFDVINLGTRVRPADAVLAAIQEDADVIGLSILSGAHIHLVRETMTSLREAGESIPVVVGGTIPTSDAMVLQEMGVARVFGPGSTTQAIVAFVDECVAHRRAGSSKPVATTDIRE